jgi:hypothetical protein
MVEIRRTLQNLEPGERYLVRARSVNPYGITSDWSEALDYAVPVGTTAPDAPSNLTANFESKDLVLAWTPPVTGNSANSGRIEGYNIYISSPQIPGVSVVYFVATNQFIYHYVSNKADFGGAKSTLDILVKAVNTTGIESEGIETTISNLPPIAPTVAPEVTAGIGSVLLSFDDYIYVDDLSAFIIERSSNFSTYTQVGETYANFFVDAPPNATDTFTYRYVVRDVFGQVSLHSPVSNGVEVLLAETEADNISVEPVSGLLATNAQEAIEELHANNETVQSNLDDHIVNPTNAHPASAISYDGSAIPGLIGTDVETVLDELHSLIVNGSALRVAEHLADPTFTRPVDATGPVVWYGTVSPDNWNAGDLWVDSSDGTVHVNGPLDTKANAATEVPLTARGAVGQTANLQEWQNSTGGDISWMDASGQINLSNIASTHTSTKAAATLLGSVITGKTVQTLDYASAAIGGVDFSPTVAFKQAGSNTGSVVGFQASPIIKNVNGIPLSLGAILVMHSNPTIRGDGAAVTTPQGTGVWTTPWFDVINAGTLAITEYANFRSGNSAETYIGAGVTITNFYGAKIENTLATGTITHNYGVWIEGQTGGANNYALYLASTAGTAAGGITFGGDTNLYRSAANTLATDDDIDITDSARGVILRSPDNTRWRVTVDDTGTLTTTEVV